MHKYHPFRLLPRQRPVPTLALQRPVSGLRSQTPGVRVGSICTSADPRLNGGSSLVGTRNPPFRSRPKSHIRNSPQLPPHPPPHRRNGGEKRRPRLASPPEAREQNSVGEVSAGELGGGGFVVAVVQEAEPGGTEEIAGAAVVDDVDLYRPASRILEQGKIITGPVCPAARWLPAVPIRPAWNWDRTNDIY